MIAVVSLRIAIMRAMTTPFTSEVFAPSGCAALTDWGVCRASGADAVGFLHGQLTHDVALVGSDRARLAAYCNPQGRMLANMVLWKRGDDVWLAMPRSVVEATLKRLRMFVMRAKCTLEDLSETFSVWGVWGEGVAERVDAVWSTLTQDNATWVRMPDGDLGSPLPRALVCAAQAPQTVSASTEQWAWLDVSAALPWVSEATAGQLVPQMVNLESLDGVSFKKGCYPGQEVVARSQFRGAIKRRGERVHGTQAMQAGQDVFAGEQAVGVVVNAQPSPQGGWDALVSLHVGEAADKVLHSPTADSPELSRWGLPYALRDDL